MVAVNGLGGVAAYRAAAKRQGGTGFRVPTAAAEAAGEAAATCAVSMPSLLGLQEAQGDVVSDRDARRHAEDALDVLRAMQLALLDGGGATAAGLDTLCRRVPEAADPGLRGVQRALVLRLTVERARHAAAASL